MRDIFSFYTLNRSQTPTEIITREDPFNFPSRNLNPNIIFPINLKIANKHQESISNKLRIGAKSIAGKAILYGFSISVIFTLAKYLDIWLS